MTSPEISWRRCHYSVEFPDLWIVSPPIHTLTLSPLGVTFSSPYVSSPRSPTANAPIHDTSSGSSEGIEQYISSSSVRRLHRVHVMSTLYHQLFMPPAAGHPHVSSCCCCSCSILHPLSFLDLSRSANEYMVWIIDDLIQYMIFGCRLSAACGTVWHLVSYKSLGYLLAIALRRGDRRGRCTTTCTIESSNKSQPSHSGRMFCMLSPRRLLQQYR